MNGKEYTPPRRSRRVVPSAYKTDADPDWLRKVPLALVDVARSLPPMVDTRLAAETCHCSERTIRDRVKRGELRGVRGGGGSSPVLIPRSELVRWLAAHFVACD